MPLKALWAKGCREPAVTAEKLWKIWDGGFWLRSLRMHLPRKRGGKLRVSNERL